jgi:hypothetical protein
MKTLALFLALPLGAAHLPSATEVIDGMIQRDADRHAGYTAMRRYTLDNKSRHATMLVRVTVSPDGTKKFAIEEESGSSAVRKHVFHKILQEEADASNLQLRPQSRISTENYSFEISGLETVNDRLAYVIDVFPKKETRYLIQGTIWVDVADLALLQVRGKPAKNPSFWTKSVQFEQVYHKQGALWVPASNHSVTDARIFGKTEMTIEYFDYLLQ